MNYYSTNNKNTSVSFKEAVIQGLPADNGLFMPQQIPQLIDEFFKELPNLNISEIAHLVLANFVGDSIPEEELWKIINKTFIFEFPLVQIDDKKFALELYHGPSYAFKDVGARFLAFCLDYFYKDQDEKCTILVATSGDTGGAVASAFAETDNIEVVILYPSGKVSELQEKQLTTFEKNVTALEIDGDFDDCQRLVKSAFLDEELRKQKMISSANSINVARFLPQSIYYFLPYQYFSHKDKIAFSVPSGNYGNLTAGLFAKQMGLPIHQFVAAANKNDTVPRYLLNGIFEPHPTVATYSNAMDVSIPSNFLRMKDMFSLEEMQQLIKGYSFSDEETLDTMQSVFKNEEYLLDPHGAVGYAALKAHEQKNEYDFGLLLETAHPCKFIDVVNKVTKEDIYPEEAKALMQKQKSSIKMKADYEQFKQFLLR
ncbi:threonine synthase [Marivirga atlantica]|jgi:threonine synthase|uniref:Threonine synthase n=1 Tax=Marivirga atlantica TaxID=1548457 RepID=A0A937A6H2_9BACT|nr:threonine synthase [Marivirga atlantica]MBL0764485.1 threonine synthase [Marivirga atlantica]